MGEAKQILADGQIDRALHLLQGVLDQESESFLQDDSTPQSPDSNAKAVPNRWLAASQVAVNTIESAAPAVVKRYRQLHEDQASHLLREADRRRDPAGWGEVARRFFLTNSGRDAVDRLASYNLDLGRAALAIFYFEKLLGSKAHANSLSEMVHAKHAAALTLLRGERPDQTQPTPQAPISLGGQPVSSDEWLSDFLNDLKPPSEQTLDEPRDNQDLNAMPLLAPDWKSPLVQDKVKAKRFIAPIQRGTNRSQTTLLGFRPLVVQGRVFFRDFDGTWAIDLKSGRRIGQIPGSNTISKELDLLDPRWAPSAAIPGANYYAFLANQVYGSMTTDGRRIFQIDDMPLTPSPFQSQVMRNRAERDEDDGKDNAIRAFDAQTLEILWTLDKHSAGSETEEGAYFFGPPLPHGELLYVLGETRSEIRLFAIEAANGRVAWQEVLGVSSRSIESDLFRRTQTCHLTLADGILVCPTNLFHVVAIDPTTRARLWEYSMAGDGPLAVQYAMSMSQSFVPPQGALPADPPLIAQGPVILSEPLGGSFHCLDLGTGTTLWRADRGRDWFLGGVFQDRVLAVGAERVRALSLRDGREIWSLPIANASGRGVAVGEHYLLPTSDGRVLALDPKKGKILDRAESRERESIGSLTAENGHVLAAGISGLVTYSLERNVQQEVNTLLAKDESDSRGRYRRAQLLLSEGKVAEGLADLRIAVRGTSDPQSAEQARLLMFDIASKEAIDVPDEIGWLAEDLKSYARNLPEKGIYYRLIAEHRVRTGQFRAAIEALDRHSALPLKTTIATETPGVERTPNVWTRAFLTRLFAMAPDSTRTDLANEYRERCSKMLAEDDLDAARKLALELAGIPLGCEIRIAIIEQLLSKRQFAEAEQRLLEVTESSDRALAAQAYAELAKLAEKGNRLAQSRYYLTNWKQRMPTTTTPQGDSVEERLAKFDESYPNGQASLQPMRWDFDKVVTPETRTSPFRPNSGSRILFPAQTSPPFFRDWLVSFDQQRWEIEFLGRRSGIVEWKLTDLPRSLNYMQESKYHHVGNLLFFTQADTVYAISGVDRRLLWTRQFQDSSLEPIRVVSTRAQVRVIGRSVAGYGANTIWPALQSAGPGYVLVRFGKTLAVLDPWTGVDLWSLDDIDANELIASDSQAVIVFLPNDVYRAYRSADGRLLAEGALGPNLPFRKGIVGRRVLVFQTDDPNRRFVRLYDPWKKVDYWSQSIPASTDWHSFDGERIVLVDRQKSFTVLDAQTGETLIHDKLDANENENRSTTSAQLHFFTDEETYFVTSMRSGPGQPLWPVSPSPNLKTLPVHGWIRAYDAATKQPRWTKELSHRAVVTSPGEELPVLVAVGNRMVDLGNNRKKLATSIEILNKSDGRVLYSEDHDQYGTMLELAYAASERWLELRGFNLRIRLDFVKKGEDAKARQEVGEETATRAMRRLLDRVRVQREKQDREK